MGVRTARLVDPIAMHQSVKSLCFHCSWSLVPRPSVQKYILEMIEIGKFCSL